MSTLHSQSQQSNKYLPFDKHISTQSPIYSKVQEIISQAWGFKYVIRHNPSPNPVSFEKKYLSNLEANITDFVIAEKSDGVRYLLVIGTVNQKGFSVMVNRKMQMFEVSLFANSDYFKGSVFDGEIVVETISTNPIQERQKYLVYDLVSINGETRHTRDFLERYNEYLQIFDVHGKDIVDYDISQWESIAFELANTKAKIVSLGNKMALQFAPKQFVQLIHVGSLWRSMSKLKHKSDGLIFSRVSAKIGTGTDHNILKWKEHHTIDVIISANYVKGKWTYRVLFQDNDKLVDSANRFFTLNDNNYQLQIRENGTLRSTCQYYAETQKPQFSLIGECSCEITSKKADETPIIWCNVVKWRRDKYTPNNIFVIQRTLCNIADNVTIDELIQISNKNMYK